MKSLINHIVRLYLKRRRKTIDHVHRNGRAYQEKWLNYLVRKGRNTEFGKSYHLNECENYEDFQRLVPVCVYEEIRPYVIRMMKGESDVLWPGRIKWFAKSAGTTDDKSKYIPISNENLFGNHIAGSWDTMAFLYDKIPNASMFAEKSLLVGGSLSSYEGNPDSIVGDISAILIHRMPSIGRPFYTPDFETAILPGWDEKLERIVELSGRENVVMIGGVPTWNIVLFRKMLDHYGKKDLLELWPNLQAYVHGGVSFKPYQQVFKELIPREDLIYQEIYNASEGFFAVQDRMEDGMLLLLDNAVFYEFIPPDQWDLKRPKAIPLWEVKTGVNYAMLVTNNSGLWRYCPGDTIEFVTVDPWRIKITGRTRHFINAFGEEVMVTNTDEALARTCADCGCIATEYTVAPIYFSDQGKGGHEWFVEFETQPGDMKEFAEKLDENLQSLNSDYQAKRYMNMALNSITLHSIPTGTFERWLRANKTMGAQLKIPRLSNDRKVADQIKIFISKGDNHG